MSIVVVILLVVLWAWILLPGAVREHRDASPASSISRFERSMAHLARLHPSRRPRGLPARGVAGREVLVPAGPEPSPAEQAAARAARRRRHVVTILTASTTLTLLVARLLGGPGWALFWTALSLLLVYLLLLGHRWVRVSQAAALPLIRPPEEEGPDPDGAPYGGQRPGSARQVRGAQTTPQVQAAVPVDADRAVLEGFGRHGHGHGLGVEALRVWGGPVDGGPGQTPFDGDGVRVIDW